MSVNNASFLTHLGPQVTHHHQKPFEPRELFVKEHLEASGGICYTTTFSTSEIRYSRNMICICNALKAQCLKITEKVSFNIASEASYVYIFS